MNDKINNYYENFLSSVIDWQNKQAPLTENLMKKITMFQYSQ